MPNWKNSNATFWVIFKQCEKVPKCRVFENRLKCLICLYREFFKCLNFEIDFWRDNSNIYFWAILAILGAKIQISHANKCDIFGYFQTSFHFLDISFHFLYSSRRRYKSNPLCLYCVKYRTIFIFRVSICCCFYVIMYSAVQFYFYLWTKKR